MSGCTLPPRMRIGRSFCMYIRCRSRQRETNFQSSLFCRLSRKPYLLKGKHLVEDVAYSPSCVMLSRHRYFAGDLFGVSVQRNARGEILLTMDLSTSFLKVRVNAIIPSRQILFSDIRFIWKKVASSFCRYTGRSENSIKKLEFGYRKWNKTPPTAFSDSRRCRRELMTSEIARCEGRVAESAQAKNRGFFPFSLKISSS